MVQRWYPLLFLAGALPGSLSANELLSAFQLARQQDPQLQVAAAQRAMDVEAVPQARAQWLPQLTANAAAGRERVRADGSPSEGSKVVNDALTLSQTVWSFQSFYNLKEADLLASEAAATYASEEQKLILRVAQAYFGILSAVDQLDTTRSQRQAFAELLHQAQVREQTGINARTDVTEAQSFYDATEQGVIDAENILEDAKRALAQITGVYPESVARLQEEIPLTRPVPDSDDEWGITARKDNLDVLAAALGSAAARRDISVQRSRYLPSLALQGSATRTQQSALLGGNEDVNLIQMAVTWPIYQGGDVSSHVRQSEAAARRADAQLELTRRQADRAARLAFRAVATGVERVKAAKRAMDSGRDAVEASRLGVEFGTRHEFDLLNSQDNYFTAVRAYRQSRYDYLTALLQLKQQAGSLVESDLESIDRLLTSGAAAE